jgi:tRNA (guanine37-N1)-methyltransferase
VSPRIEFDLLTLFPAMVEGFLQTSMLGRASREGLVRAEAHDLRNWAVDKHQTTDDRPFGGGPGMVMKPEPFFAAVAHFRREESKVIYLAPDGEPLSTALARELAAEKHLILLSGHYEGVDQRVRDHLVDREVSIGDYVLTNGTLAAAVLVDCVSRYVPGVLGEEKSLTQDSFSNTLLGFPQYTRPADYDGMRVPEILLSGDHQTIERWRKEQQISKTRQLRPDLLPKGDT